MNNNQTNHNEKQSLLLSERNTSTRKTKMNGMNRKILALVLMVTFLLTMIPVIVLASNEDAIHYSDSNVVDIDGLSLNKTVVQDETNPDKYHVTLEAFAEKDTIEQPITDIVMTMDLSSRMGLDLYQRTYKNLNTHTYFVPINSSDATYNHMHDKDNPNNTASIDIGNSYSSNKYVEDPNTPGVYVYLASRYSLDVWGIFGDGVNFYTYTFMDSLGNTYVSDPVQKSISESVRDGVGTLHFTLQGTAIGDAKPSVDISDYYQRINAENNSLVTTIVDSAGNSQITEIPGTRTGSVNILNYGTYYWDETVTYDNNKIFIIDDYGERAYIKIVLKRAVAEEHRGILSNKTTYTNQEYEFSCVDSKGVPYKIVYGNPEYGADYSVFQGFKVYKDDNGDGYLEVDHSQSIESKSLYTTSGGETVTRLQAMKEASEKFIIQLHQDAYKKNPDVRNPNVRLGIITYGDGATVQYNLPEINLSDEVQTNAAIDKIYGFTASSRPASELDYAMNAVQNQFTSYSVEGTTSDGDGGKENKKISILFSSGVPTRKDSNWFGNPRVSEYYYNETVANNAIHTANSMKNDLGVLSYTVGLFNGASDTQRALYGDKFEYSQKAYHPDVACTGEVGSSWGATTFAYLTNGWVHSVDVPATNRLMNFISSNYSDADALGLTWKTNLNPGHYTWRNSGLPTFGGSGWEITNKYSASSEGHYFAIPIEEDVDLGEEIDQEMKSIFGEIASAIEIPSSTLGEEDELIDFVTEYFDIVDDSISAHTETPADPAHYRNTTWTSNNDENSFKNNIVKTDKKISVSGFDYQNHSMTKADPRKLVLEFDVTRKTGLIGGNDIPTNTSLSGVYDNDLDEETHNIINTLMEEAFVVPSVDLDIKTSTMTNDAAVYYGSAQDLRELITTENVNGFNNRFVDISYEIYEESENGSVLVNTYTVEAGSSEGDWTTKITADEGGDNVQNLDKVFPQMTETTKYRIVCTVDPTIRSGSLDSPVPIQEGEGETLADPTATVYVFKPYVEVENDELPAPGEYDLTENPELVEWKAFDTTGAELTGQDLIDARALLKEDDIEPSTTLIIETVDKTKTAVTDDNVEAYQIDETMDFVVSKVQVVPNQFTYESWEHLSHEEETDSGTVIVDDGYAYMEHTINADPDNLDWPAVDATYDNGGAIFLNKSPNDGRIDGSFTITVGKYFDLVINKEFTGEFANAQEITITVTPFSDNDSLDTNDAKSVTFTKEEFSRSGDKFIANNAKSISHIDANTSYLITETFKAGSIEAGKYDVLFVATSNNQPVLDGDGSSDNNEFKLEKGNDEFSVEITITNQAKSLPPITGYSEDTGVSNILLIALAATATLAAGGYGVYRVYRQRKEN